MTEDQERVEKLRPTGRTLPIALLRARETVMAPVREMLAQSGVSEQKWRVLRVLDESGPMEQKRIAELACLLLPSLTRMLHAMEADGLVLRQTDSRDKRKSIVSISEAGAALIRAHAEESNAIFDRLEARFGREETNTLLDLLEKLQQTDF